MTIRVGVCHVAAISCQSTLAFDGNEYVTLAIGSVIPTPMNSESVSS